MNDQTQERLAELEIRFMQQEQLLEALNEQLYLQQREAQRLSREVDELRMRLKSLGTSPVASQAEETPPPHY